VPVVAVPLTEASVEVEFNEVSVLVVPEFNVAESELDVVPETIVVSVAAVPVVADTELTVVVVSLVTVLSTVRSRFVHEVPATSARTAIVKLNNLLIPLLVRVIYFSFFIYMFMVFFRMLRGKSIDNHLNSRIRTN
jgi:hypothetical protein